MADPGDSELTRAHPRGAEASKQRSSRRDALRRAGGGVVAGGVAYSAPQLLSMPVAAAQSGGGTPTSPPPACPNCSRNSNVARTATMTAGAPYDPVRYAAWHNKTYDWSAKFDCAVDETACTVTATIRVRFPPATA